MKRRSLVTTDETARHPFLALIPPHVRHGGEPIVARPAWKLTASDVTGFLAAYVATLTAALVFIA